MKKRIADYILKQSTGGSPECTTTHSAKLAQKDINTPHGTCSPAALVGQSCAGGTAGQSSLKQKTSDKKKSKRRSVSFRITNDQDESESKQDTGQKDPSAASSERSDKVEEVKKTPISFPSPTHHMQDRECNQSQLCRYERSSTENSVKSKDHNTTDKKDTLCSTLNKDAPTVSRKQCGRQDLTVKSDTAVCKQLKQRDVTLPEGKADHAHKVDDNAAPHVQEVTSPCEAKTPPEDTQLDLFADSAPQDESLGILSCTHNSGNVPQDETVTSAGFVQQLSPLGRLPSENVGRTIVKCLDASFDKAENVIHDHDMDDSVIIVQSSNVKDMSYYGVACTSGNIQETKTMPCDTFIHDNISSKKDAGSQVENVSVSGAPDLVTNATQELSQEDSSDDPDIIPGTYSEGEGTRNTIGTLSRKKSLGQSVTIQDGGNLGKNTGRHVIYLSSEPRLTPTKATECPRSPSNKVCLGITETPDRNDEEYPCHQEMKANSQSDVYDIQPLHHGIGNTEAGENLQRTEIHSINSVRNAESPHVEPAKSSSEADRKELAGKVSKEKGRRRSQKSLDNLSMDDLRLKEFVLSQQSSQEGTHTWIDGLLYPAEYYVRKTRSMSKYSPKQHSAPVTGQQIARVSPNRRRGSCVSDCQKEVFSEPLQQKGYLEQRNALGKDNELDESKAMTSTCMSLASQEEAVPSQGTCQDSEPSKKSKVKVSRKPAATRRKRGRKPFKRKMEPVQSAYNEGTQEEGPVGLQKVVTEQDVCVTSSSLNALNQGGMGSLDSQEVFNEQPSYFPGSDVSVMTVKEGDVCGSYSITQGLEEVNFVHTTVTTVSKKSTEDVPNKRSTEKPSSTQVTHNPLESQFTQTQMPDHFALPTVFGSPGCETQNLVGLSPGSPSSPTDLMLRNAIGSPLTCQTISHDGTENTPVTKDHETISLKKECHGEQWMSQAYLADIVPELPDASKTLSQNSCINPGNVTNLLFSEPQDELLHSQELIDDGTPHLAVDVNDDEDRRSQVTDVSMKSWASQTPKMDAGIDNIQKSQDVISCEVSHAASNHVNQTVDPTS